jgi:DNA-binding transcriptional LysR family regulator
MKSDNSRAQSSHIRLTRRIGPAALRCFEAAAELESFSRAADRLGLTHGAVSRAVRQIEDELGALLFERRNRAVFLTQAGGLLAEAVRSGFARIDAAAQTIKTRARRRPIVLSCEPTLMMKWLIPRFAYFQAAHPNIEIHLTAGGGPVALGEGVDLAIRRDDFVFDERLVPHRLFAERVGPVCRPDRLEAFFEEVPKGAPKLRQDAALLHSRTRPQAWADWLRRGGLEVPQRASHAYFEHFYFSLQAAVSGLGVAIAPWRLAREEIAAGVLAAPFGFVEDASAYHLLSLAPIEADQPTGLFLAWLRQEAARDEEASAAQSA